MTSCCNGIWKQVAAIVVLGTAIGVADAFWWRHLDLELKAPPPLPAPSENSKPPVTPVQPTNSTSQTPSNTTSSSTPNAPQGATPSTSGVFQFTPKDKLPVGHITVDEAKGLYDQGAIFVDARKIEPYAEGHVANAYRLELAMFDGGDPPILGMITRDSVIVSYCSGGNCDESEAVARRLNGSGYNKVYILHDGFPGWKAKGFPSETGKGIEQ